MHALVSPVILSNIINGLIGSMPLQTCQDSEKCYYNLSIHSCASEILQNWNRAIDITFSIHLFFFFLFFFIPSSSRTDERRVAAGPARGEWRRVALGGRVRESSPKCLRSSHLRFPHPHFAPLPLLLLKLAALSHQIWAELKRGATTDDGASRGPHSLTRLPSLLPSSLHLQAQIPPPPPAPPPQPLPWQPRPPMGQPSTSSRSSSAHCGRSTTKSSRWRSRSLAGGS